MMTMTDSELDNNLTSDKTTVRKNPEQCDRANLRRILNEFNSIHHDTKTEKAIQFLDRFDDLRKKLASIDPNLLTPVYVKTIFELAIEETATFKKAELSGFKYSLSELRGMLLEEQIRGELTSPPGETSFTMVRGTSTNRFSRGRGSFRRGIRGHFPGQFRQFDINKTYVSSKPDFKNSFCAYCKRRGHSTDYCYKAPKRCFNRGSDSHSKMINCPFPLRKVFFPMTLHTPSSANNVSCNLDSAQTVTPPVNVAPENQPGKENQSKSFRIPLSQAKNLVKEFENQTDAVISVIGPTDEKDSEDIWVTLGSREEQHISTINLMSELQGTGKLFNITEGVPNKASVREDFMRNPRHQHWETLD